MDVLNRYLYEIRRYLPPADQDDVIAEISDAIQSRIEEREQKIGRALDSAEVTDIIKDFGHPKLVASRYQPAQYLIGPETYPFFWYTVKIALAGVLALELLGALIAGTLSPTPLQTFFRIIAAAWTTIFLAFGVVVFIFAALERTGSGTTVLAKLGINKWNPRTLPRATQGEVSRFSLLIEAFANGLFMLWLLDFVPLRRAIGVALNAAGGSQSLAPLALTSNWRPLLLLAFVAAALIVVQDLLLLVDPARVKLRAATLLTSNVLLVIGSCWVLPSQEFVITHSTAQDYIAAATALNLVARASIVILALGCAVAAIFNVRMLLHRMTRPDLNITPAETS